MTVPVVRFVFGGREARASDEGRPFTLVYDGTCRVCTRLVNLLRKWDRRNQIEIVPSQNASVHARFPWIPPEAYAEAVQLVARNGRTWQGATAIERLLDILPRGELIGWVFKLPLVGWLADRFYRWFAKNRYRFGCGEHCQLRPEQLDYVGSDGAQNSA